MLNAAQARLLTEPNPAIVTTLRHDGSAHSSLMWVDWDGEYVIVNTTVGRIKEYHLRRDNRITVCGGPHEHQLPRRRRGPRGAHHRGCCRARPRVVPAISRCRLYLQGRHGADHGALPSQARLGAIWDEMEEEKTKAGRDWEQHSHLDIRSSKAQSQRFRRARRDAPRCLPVDHADCRRPHCSPPGSPKSSESNIRSCVAA
jgi:hypothetical protein